MRPLLLLLFLTLTGPAMAQQRVIALDTLPKSGKLVLEKGWRWHAGDDRAWANPAIDDSRWDSLRPTRKLENLDTVRKQAIGWLRLRFSVDGALANSQLTMNVYQAGASEIYLDGRLIQQYGTVSRYASGQVSYTPTDYEWSPLTLTTPGPHVLAVRWSFHKPAWYVPIDRAISLPMFEATLRPAATLMEKVALPEAQDIRNPLVIGVFGMLSAVQLLYYLYRRQPVNLYFGLTTLFFTLGRCISLVRSFQPDLVTKSWLSFLSSLCLLLYVIYLCATFMVFMNKRLNRTFWLFTAISMLATLIDQFTELAFVPELLLAGGLGGLFVHLLVTTTTALRTQRTNARLVLNCLLFIASVILCMIVITAIIGTRNPLLGLIGPVSGMIINLTIPLTLAVILARENAQTNRDLEARLKDVEKLSEEKESILTHQKDTLEQEVAQRTATLNKSLQELRNTQTQLVQREKMASLGELTAGIAHEIQNPLNFVNNFADVSGELIAELRQEQTRPDRDPGLEAELLTDIEQNVSKIGHHGVRAASIVRGMLEHARTSTGERQPTDLNALADEYMRLSYHGLRAKDKHGSTGRSNATLVTDFDRSLTPISVISQDIGRVLLNLFNNAFYAVQEKAKTAPESYKPTVSVSTKQTDVGVEIRVSDNGNGIPLALQRKIFQPFFTTKPTGEGTGLGLSLSFDIITKGHGGSLTVDTCPGQFTTFIIRLPANL
jgi:two-component system, NtrC family, sensor kinase